MEGIDIVDYTGEGYHRLIDTPAWTLAMINWADRFDEKNFYRVERHLKSDETFVLLTGKATLVIGEKAERLEMEPFKYYNIKAGTWHHILVSKDAKVLIAENADTGLDNSEYLEVAK